MTAEQILLQACTPGVVYLDVCGSEYRMFDQCTVELDQGIALRILRMSEAVRELKIYKAVTFDHRVEPLNPDDDAGGNEVRLECVCMNVTDTGVFWSGYVKHTDDRWETDSIPLDRLQAVLDEGADFRDRD